MRRQHVIRCKRVGQYAHSNIALVQRFHGGLSPGGQDEVGRFDEQLLFQLRDTLANEFDDIIALLAWDDALRIVCNDSTVCHTRLSRSSALSAASRSRSWSIG